MNKQAYRVVFNKTRGLLMAVAECAMSQGKSTADSPARTSAVGFHVSGRSNLLKKLILALLTVFASQVTLPVCAQVVAAPNAPAGQTPLIDASKNGVPIVHVAPPSKNGVSNNLYANFNVGTNGLIFNNSTTATNTQLGGQIGRNLQYSTVPASIILNQVTSGNSSTLLGQMEVAGAKADVVIANPNGITCNGCSFINTNGHSTLTTGVPQLGLNGNLLGFSVTQGNINIGSGGLNASNQEQLDLIARGLVIEGQIWSQGLNAIVGSNKVLYASTGTIPQVMPQAGTGAMPSFAIDIKNLGGMYANQIYLISSDKGLGVNSTGRIAALQGNLNLSSAGDLTLKDTTATKNITITTANNSVVNLTGQTVADGITINAGQIQNAGILQGTTTLSLNSPVVSNSGSISSTNTSQVLSLGSSNTSASFSNTGNISAPAGIDITTGQLNAKGGASAAMAPSA